MHYVAVLKKEGRNTLIEFPTCPGCQTYAAPGENVLETAREALEGWLEAQLVQGNAPPAPKRVRASTRRKLLEVDVTAKLAVKLAIRWARLRAGLTQADLAKRAGLTQPMIARLEHPDWNPTIETLEKVAKALGARLEVELAAA